MPMSPIFVIVTQFLLDFNRFFQMCKVKFPVEARILSLHTQTYAAAVCGGSDCEAVWLSVGGTVMDCSAAF